jgi:hypothetical protein
LFLAATIFLIFNPGDAQSHSLARRNIATSGIVPNGSLVNDHGTGLNSHPNIRARSDSWNHLVVEGVILSCYMRKTPSELKDSLWNYILGLGAASSPYTVSHTFLSAISESR